MYAVTSTYKISQNIFYDYEEEEAEEGLKEQSLPTIEAGDRLPV